MTAITERAPLLEVKPELIRHLTEDERAELAGVRLPVVELRPGPVELGELLAEHKAFGATVLEGLVMGSLRVGDQTGVHVLGPGDVLPGDSELAPSWLTATDYLTAAPARLALFGNDLLVAVHRWPRILQGLYASICEQLQRLTAQLVICQLPRVEDRVVDMLWLLAESWGYVTPGGIRLPLALTHETLGALIGARRPTVTLAVHKLTDQGELLPQDSGWLLLRAPTSAPGTSARVVPAESAGTRLGLWATAPAPAPALALAPDPSIAYAELRDTVQRLRVQHRTDRENTSEQLSRIRAERARVSTARRRIAEDAVTRRPPPSS
jgi:CRP/FNR family transcriptional regulator, cyclic AMP receptor protein